ncbi:MAG: prepilin-type N-terminal cleavage/methylation domain-containing protein [Longimicrobiales bacterium]|nr:prepilin-type N-terminal cleavage/methylation domain-containing protein [Longimicrobiales bacterium]
MNDPSARVTRRMPGDGRGGSCRGFTMVELVFVLLILLVLTSLVAPAISPARWRADGAVHNLAMTMSAAQRNAVLRQHDMIVQFLEDERFIGIHSDADNDGDVDPGEDTRVVDLPETMGFGNAGAPELPADFAIGPLVPVGASNPHVTFHRSGSASAAGALYLSPVDGKHRADSRSARALTVERSTGAVRCYSYASGAWEPAC